MRPDHLLLPPSPDSQLEQQHCDILLEGKAPLLKKGLIIFKVKNGHILHTGQWHAPSAVINDALIMPEYARACQSMPEYAKV